ncbi:MAG: hypothetical protein LDL41_15875 [Coleofasciculus sp. S288]|nr:hypothetical protein [Coleofasciculus sp. S288]
MSRYEQQATGLGEKTLTESYQSRGVGEWVSRLFFDGCSLWQQVVLA